MEDAAILIKKKDFFFLFETVCKLTNLSNLPLFDII